MVLVDGTEGCEVKHESYESARREAERLLHETGMYGVTILESVTRGVKLSPPVEWTSLAPGPVSSSVSYDTTPH